ncbi:hypothetical protein J3R30DRAFT_3500237 [Lentinula aciculospora]|uniref:Uncharacterized protein n=1 Tax=Lentinula aciculospora TaxID=153920 RepID=A0A9W9DL36_9AGAR|nr:hypothetical protein J3R30DRAFT_3500237 [Lentinula aciculospora]
MSPLSFWRLTIIFCAFLGLNISVLRVDAGPVKARTHVDLPMFAYAYFDTRTKEFVKNERLPDHPLDIYTDPKPQNEVESHHRKCLLYALRGFFSNTRVLSLPDYALRTPLQAETYIRDQSRDPKLTMMVMPNSSRPSVYTMSIPIFWKDSVTRMIQCPQEDEQESPMTDHRDWSIFFKIEPKGTSTKSSGA